MASKKRIPQHLVWDLFQVTVDQIGPTFKPDGIWQVGIAENDWYFVGVSVLRGEKYVRGFAAFHPWEMRKCYSAKSLFNRFLSLIQSAAKSLEVEEENLRKG